MVGIYSDPITTNQGLAALGTDSLPATTGQVFGAQWDEAVSGAMQLPRFLVRQSMALPTLSDETGESFANPSYRPPATADEANARYGIDGHLKFTNDIPLEAAAQINETKRDELAREDVFHRAQGGLAENTGRVAIGLAGGLLDPLNIAASFIPVVGEARYAQWLLKAGGAFGRLGVRAGVGAVEGAAGMAAIEPLRYGMAKAEYADYTAVDSLLNVGFGAGFGALLHGGAGALGDALGISGFARGRAALEALRTADPATHEAALRGAVAATAEDRPIRIKEAHEAAGALPIVSESEWRQLSEEAGLREKDRALAGRQDEIASGAAVAPPRDEVTARATLARLAEVERQLKDETISPSLRRTLLDRRDELLIDTNPETLRAAVAPVDEGAALQQRRENIAARLAEIATTREQAAAAAALSPLPKTAAAAADAATREQRATRLDAFARQQAADRAPDAVASQAADRAAAASRAPVDSTLAEHTAELEALIKRHQDAGNLPDTIPEIEAANQGVKDANGLADAYEAAAVCLMKEGV